MLMRKEILLQNKKEINILMISGILLLFIILFLKPICIFKYITRIPCPMCGITRGIKSILNFNIIDSLKYNLLSIPTLLFITTFYILYILSIILRKNYISCYYNYFVINYKTIIYILLINWLINILKGMF